MPATALMPTLSEVEAWRTEHLDAAATSWTSTAQAWENAFTTVYRQAAFPGGTPWDGEAAEAAVMRVGRDRLAVLAAVDTLHDAAGIARSGASEIQVAKQMALKALADARAAGFTVGEDLSVTSRINGGPPAFQAARRVQAEAFAANIGSRAVALAAIDEQVASRITTAAASFSGMQFNPNPARPGKPSIQAVDNRTLPQEPPPPGPNGPPKPIKTGKDVKDLLDTFEPGRRKGVVTLPTAPEIEGLFEDLTADAAEAPPSDYPGTSRMLPDGTRIGLRKNSVLGGPTIDVVYPDGTAQDVHLPIVSELPNLPSAQVTRPPLLPPWLQDPSPPGFQITPGKPMTVPWDWGLQPGPAPVPAPITAQSPSSGPTSTGSLGSQLAPLSPDQAAQAGTATAMVGGLGILAWLAMLLYQN